MILFTGKRLFVRVDVHSAQAAAVHVATMRRNMPFFPVVSFSVDTTLTR